MNNQGPIDECCAKGLEARLRVTTPDLGSVAGSGSTSQVQSGEAAWRELKQARRPIKGLLEAELFMQKVKEGKNQIKASPKNCTWFRISGVCEGIDRLVRTRSWNIIPTGKASHLRVSSRKVTKPKFSHLIRSL